MWRVSVLVLLASLGCNDSTFVVYNTAPTVSIVDPLDGAELDEGEALFLEGLVADDGSLDDLSVDWIDSVTGTLVEDAEIEDDGSVRFVTSNLESGDHTIVLRAIDLDAQTGEDQVGISLLPVPERPSILIDHPDPYAAPEELGLEESTFVFMATVGDRQDAVEDLMVEVVASPYGLVCTMYPDGAGVAQCPAVLPFGTYNLTFTVTDTDGNEAAASGPFSVVTRDDFDMDGDGYPPSGGDCNDANPDVYPGAPEICDGLDNDCIPETGIDVGTECYDDDGDGYCESPPCVNTANTLADCDDTDADRYPDPSVQEEVNGLDDDCDGLVDEETVVYDDDGDGMCEVPPCVNTSSTDADCDDTDPYVNPTAAETCGDGIDNDCDGLTNELNAVGCTPFFYDGDGDTYGVSGPAQCWCAPGEYPYTGLNRDDCYDSNANAHPGQTAFFTTDRGDSRYDYDCNGSQEKQYTGRFSSCNWDFEPFSCDIGADGWRSSGPACGGSGTWVGDCDGSYDAVCIFLCAYADPSLCTSCWDCVPDESSLQQGCR